jgi:peptide/nickel transport system permease protein
MIIERLPNTISLGLSSFFLSMVIAFSLGVLGATKRGTWIDGGVKMIAVLGQALPGFWVSIMAIFIFSVKLRLLPTSGKGTIFHFILPASTMAFFMLPGIMRLVRSSMLDVLDSEYIKLARIKGLPERIIIWKHAMRNALITPLTAAAMIFRLVLTGAVVTETVFSWPGIGRLLVDSISTRDFPITQGVVLMMATLVLLINLLVDISYAYIDPQIRYQSS